jgi:uncharacterized membrane protein YhaH (DUF805 family)
MAGGNVQPGTSAPEQMPQTYGQQMPQAYGQQYMPPAQPTDFGEMMRKTFLVFIVLIGAILMFVGRAVSIFAGSNVDNMRIGQLLWTFGVFGIAGPAAIWGIGSKRLTDMQKFGVLILAALLFASTATSILIF